MNFKSVFRWETIGKIGVLLSIIWVSVQLFNYFSSTTGKIRATMKSSKFILPALIEKNMFTSLPNEIINSLNKLNSDRDTSLKQFRGALFKYERLKHFHDYLTSKITNYDYNNFKYYRYFWTINLINPSSKLVQSINVDIETDGYYQLISQDDSSTASFYTHNIQIGDLRPQNKATLFVWSSYTSEVKKVKINYKDGFIIPEEIKEVTGFYGWLSKYSLTENIFLRLLPFLLICYLIFSTIILVIKKRSGLD
jgi:hypothetical protein